MHHGDLAGGAAERERRDAEPNAKGLAVRYAVAGRCANLFFAHDLVQAVLLEGGRGTMVGPSGV